MESSVISCFLSLSSNWEFHFPRNIRDSEIDELSSLLNHIQNFHLSPSRSASRFWSLSASGLYFVLPFPLLFLTSHPQFFFPYKTIWFSRIPSKILAFLGKIAWNPSPTLDVVQSFFSQCYHVPNVCSLCLVAVEAKDHLSICLLVYLEIMGPNMSVG